MHTYIEIHMQTLTRSFAPRSFPRPAYLFDEVISGQPENKRLEDPGLKGVLATPLISLVLWISWRGWKRGRQPVLGKVWEAQAELVPWSCKCPFSACLVLPRNSCRESSISPLVHNRGRQLGCGGWLTCTCQLQDIPNPKVPPKSWGLRLQPRLGADNLMNLRRIAEGARVCVARNHMGWACWVVSDCFLMFLTPGFCPE